MTNRPLGWVRAEVDHLRSALEWGLADELLRLICLCSRRRAAQDLDPAALAKIAPLIDDGVVLIVDGKAIPAMVAESIGYAEKQSAAGAAGAAKRRAPEPLPEPVKAAPQPEPQPEQDQPKTKGKSKAKGAAPAELPEWVPANLFADFAESRRLMKRPLTELAAKQTLAKLEEFSGRDSRAAAEILSNSIANGWQGIFPIKQTGRTGRPSGPSTSFDHDQAEDILTHRSST